MFAIGLFLYNLPQAILLEKKTLTEINLWIKLIQPFLCSYVTRSKCLDHSNLETQFAWSVSGECFVNLRENINY